MTSSGAKTPSARRTSVLWLLCLVALTVQICAIAGAFVRAQSPGDGQLRGAEATIADVTDEARIQFEAGQYGDVVTTLKASPAYASNPAAFFWLGRAHLELGDYANAIADLERAVALGPNDSEAHRWLGRAYGEQADRTRSFSLGRRVRAEFEEAVRLDSKNLAAHQDLLAFHLEAPWIVGGSDSRARRELAAIAALDAVAGHLARGAYFKHHDDSARAAAEYAAVLEARPAHLDYTFEAAEFYERAGDAAGLRAAIETATAVDAADPRVLYYRGVLDIMTQADFHDAESSLNAYLKVPPRSDRPNAVQTHEWLGRLYERVGSPTRAIAEYGKALALAPGRDSAKKALRRLQQD
jgi:tetratricopeptide (TPR) repeat protein